MNWDMITKEIQQIIIMFGLIQLLVWLLTILIIWYFLKSAVREGVKEAVKQNIIEVRLHDVTNGVVVDVKDVTPRDTYYIEKQQMQNNYTPQQNTRNSWRNSELYKDAPFLK